MRRIYNVRMIEWYHQQREGQTLRLVRSVRETGPFQKRVAERRASNLRASISDPNIEVKVVKEEPDCD